jgi:hypothetical protein
MRWLPRIRGRSPLMVMVPGANGEAGAFEGVAKHLFAGSAPAGSIPMVGTGCGALRDRAL